MTATSKYSVPSTCEWPFGSKPGLLTKNNDFFVSAEKFSSRVNHISAFETKYFDQKVDHFSFATNRTYKQRYLIDDQYWNVDGGPIFYFVGCEGPIVSSAGHSVSSKCNLNLNNTQNQHDVARL